MHVDEAKRRLLEAEILPANVVEGRLDEWSGTGDGEDFLRFLVWTGDLTALEHSSIVTGVPADIAIGPYRILEEIGLGRIGRTFRARHDEFDQTVSLKVFPSGLAADPERAGQLARETRVAVQVNDPHVVRTFQVGRVDRFVFLVQEDLAGETLAARLAREGRLPFLESLRIARQTALGLAHLHELGIVHRDVRPKNIWLHTDGRALLTEFAAARDALEFLDVDDRGTEDGGFTFTEDELVNYDFLSAEQGVDPTFADERSDLYSLGCILYRCLTGEVVFPDANPVRKMLRHALTEAPRVSEIAGESHAGIDEVAAMLLAKSPNDRYQKASEVAWALERLIATDVERAVAVDEVNPDFLAWANSTPDLLAEPSAGVVADREFLRFLEHLVDEEADQPDDNELDASEGTLI